MNEALSRRALLRAGGGLSLAALGLGYGAGTVSAAVPTSKRFQLGGQASHDLYRNRELYNGTVMQSFAFDRTNQRLFTAQLREGSPGTSGDLCVTELAWSTWTAIGHMYLTGFGHAVSIGAQSVGTSTYLWTDVDADAAGYGRRPARFKYSDGTTLTASSPAVTTYTPKPSADRHTCATDPTHHRMIVRYLPAGSGIHRFAPYDLTAATNGDFGQPPADFRQPDRITYLDPDDTTVRNSFQGYTAYGQYLYCLTGHSDTDDATLWSVDMNTGAVMEEFLTGAGSTLTFREPEGMAVHTTAGGEPRLFFGFASGSTPGERLANVFYKNVLV
ncbi:phage baseplate protein [Streptomyces acidicola]|uniref:Teichoic acid biosynthesis protein C n=1 Tax=Streptomyces acidicola TaxID=2596892 RepID=A0A5N8X039_9ACTN|nr:teichoic acid biosynthesis protein C [Streptomyces acidicola]MPY52652.1 teichoic acid biosynthesis protein C [Streptomyces acidicola]